MEGGLVMGFIRVFSPRFVTGYGPNLPNTNILSGYLYPQIA